MQLVLEGSTNTAQYMGSASESHHGADHDGLTGYVWGDSVETFVTSLVGKEENASIMKTRSKLYPSAVILPPSGFVMLGTGFRLIRHSFKTRPDPIAKIGSLRPPGGYHRIERITLLGTYVGSALWSVPGHHTSID